MKNRRILVTGGAGFIGSHLTDTLINLGYSVTVIDDLSSGRWENLSHLRDNPRLKLIISSAADTELLEREVPRVQFVYHLASSVGVKMIMDRAVRTVENIFQTTDAVFGVCAKYRRPVLLTSTSEVYGKSEELPFREESDVVMGATSKRRWAYACAKALDEFLALAYYHEQHLPVYVVRLFNTVGPRQTGQYGMVLPTFLDQALARKPITVYGDGSQQRCFCSVHDVVDALVRFLDGANCEGKVINIGSQNEISILDLARRVKTLTGSDSDIQFIPYEKAYGSGFDDMERRVPDITRAATLLGWRPVRTLDDIIASMMNALPEAEQMPAFTAAAS